MSVSQILAGSLSAGTAGYIENHYTVLASSDPFGGIPSEPTQFFFLTDRHDDIATQVINAGLINEVEREVPSVAGRGQLLLECEPSMRKVRDVASHQMSIGIEAPLQAYGWDSAYPDEMFNLTSEEYSEMQGQQRPAMEVKRLEYKAHRAGVSELDLDEEILKTKAELECHVVSPFTASALRKWTDGANSLSLMNVRLGALVRTVDETSLLPGNKYFLMGANHATNLGLYTIAPLLERLQGKTFLILQANTPKGNEMHRLRPENLFAAGNREPKLPLKVAEFLVAQVEERATELSFKLSNLLNKKQGQAKARFDEATRIFDRCNTRCQAALAEYRRLEQPKPFFASIFKQVSREIFSFLGSRSEEEARPDRLAVFRSFLESGNDVESAMSLVRYRKAEFDAAYAEFKVGATAAIQRHESRRES